MSIDLRRRAELHAALSDVGRLRILDAIGAGDRSPSDLARELGMASNLMAHHLNVLVQAGLVLRTQSESDRRRHYVRLVPESLEALGSLSRMPGPTGRVLFVCTANSARSQLAAALWKQRVGPAASAGTAPADAVHPGALAVAARHGLRLTPTKPVAITQARQQGDVIVTVCDAADREIEDEHLHWSVPDPVRRATSDAFEDAFEALNRRIELWAG